MKVSSVNTTDRTAIAERLFEAIVDSNEELLDIPNQKRRAARKVVTSFITGAYSELPLPVQEELRNFARLSISTNKDRAVIGIKTTGSAMILFLIDFYMTDRGIELGPATFWSAPESDDDDDIPLEFQDTPMLALDLTVGL